jgi:hypothetical protein
MPRVLQTLSLPQGAQIEIEYNLRRPSIRTIVRQVEALGYWVIVEPFQNQPDIINGGFTSQRVGAHVLRITYPHPFDPRRNEEEIAMTRLQQVRIDSVDVEVTEDLMDIDPLAAPHTSRSHTPYPIFEDPSSEFYGLTTIQYQRGIILWLEREYGWHVQVKYTLYEEYLVAQNQRQNIYPKYTACLPDLLLLNRVIKRIVHNDAWYLPENPEFEYGCVINIRGSSVYSTIPRG